MNQEMIHQCRREDWVNDNGLPDYQGQKSMLDPSLLYTNKFYGDLRFGLLVELKVHKESIHLF